jgi:hypothetical protein
MVSEMREKRTATYLRQYPRGIIIEIHPKAEVLFFLQETNRKKQYTREMLKGRD